MAKRRKHSKKWISRLIFLVLLAAAVAVCYFVWDAYFRDDGKRIEDDEETVVAIDNDKKDDDKTEQIEDNPVDDKEIAQYDGDNPNENERLTGVITYLGVSGGSLVIRVNIDQYLAGGNCKLSVIRAGEVLYEDSASVIDSAATSTCEGFNVALDGVGSGKVQIRIDVNSDGRVGVISGETEI